MHLPPVGGGHSLQSRWHAVTSERQWESLIEEPSGRILDGLLLPLSSPNPPPRLLLSLSWEGAGARPRL